MLKNCCLNRLHIAKLIAYVTFLCTKVHNFSLHRSYIPKNLQQRRFEMGSVLELEVDEWLDIGC